MNCHELTDFHEAHDSFITMNNQYILMKNQTALNPTFWSGVISYVRAAAQPAEALTPWDYREHVEAKTVLVFRTSVEGITEQSRVASGLDTLVGTKNWTIDLDDVDKVLRVVCTKSSEAKIVSIFGERGYQCELMA